MILTITTEEEAIKQPCRRPKGSRQGSPFHTQEGAISHQLPRIYFQLAKG